MSALIKALLPTHADLMDDDVHFFTVTYTWQHTLLGELRGSTVITGQDEEAALQAFRSKHTHLTNAWIVK